MKVVVQRVSQASVSIGKRVQGAIGKGFLILFGAAKDDTDEDLEYIVKKVTSLRIFEDSDGKMNLSLKDVGGELLVISQFTLFADTKKGNRPSFIQAGLPEPSKAFYLRFIQRCRESGFRTEEGEFGADMDVSLTNQGPVTIIIDSKNR